MKALYTTGPGQYSLVDRPCPMPADNEVLVKVARSGLCHTDVSIRDGTAIHVQYPVIPGHEFSGIIESCGTAVKYFKPGDRVAVHVLLGCGHCQSCHMGDPAGCIHFTELGASSDGGFAEYCVVPSHHLYRIPDQMTLEEAALIEPLANAISAVRCANVKLGDRVVVIGPGPIGLLAVQVARLAHPSVLVLVGTREERLKFGNQCGATHTVNIKQEGAVDRLKGILGGPGADVVLECAGTRSALDLALEVIGQNGRLVIEGAHDADELVPISPYRFLVCHGVSLIGVCGWKSPDFVQAIQLMSGGLVNVKPLITHFFKLDDWEDAFDMITRRKSKAIKVLFEM